jgi:hypothetical protein
MSDRELIELFRGDIQFIRKELSKCPSKEDLSFIREDVQYIREQNGSLANELSIVKAQLGTQKELNKQRTSTMSNYISTAAVIVSAIFSSAALLVSCKKTEEIPVQPKYESRSREMIEPVGRPYPWTKSIKRSTKDK